VVRDIWPMPLDRDHDILQLEGTKPATVMSDLSSKFMKTYQKFSSDVLCIYSTTRVQARRSLRPSHPRSSRNWLLDLLLLVSD
jgi:hypothetical protein